MTETFTLRRSTVSIKDSIESRAGLMTNLVETPISALPDLLNMPTPPLPADRRRAGGRSAHLHQRRAPVH